MHKGNYNRYTKKEYKEMRKRSKELEEKDDYEGVLVDEDREGS